MVALQGAGTPSMPRVFQVPSLALEVPKESGKRLTRKHGPDIVVELHVLTAGLLAVSGAMDGTFHEAVLFFVDEDQNLGRFLQAGHLSRLAQARKGRRSTAQHSAASQ